MIFFRFENPLFLSLELTGKLIVIFVDTSYAMLWKRSMFFLLTLYFFSPLNRERQIKEILAMRALQASTSYSVGFGVSSLDSRSIPSRYRHIMSAKVEPTEKSVEVMRKFSEQYARKSGTYFCVDKSVTSVVIKGLAEHKDTLGAPLCPCRHYDDKAAEAQQGFWNCPCVPMRERKECHCMLFLTPENDFAGQEQAISLEEIKETTSNM